jgi:SAM-dependent methyltransferase
MIVNSTERFSSRVENYVKYRPGYPSAIINFLAGECSLSPATVVADIGSGTGKLTELFLKNGNVVFGVEPNEPMRAAAEKWLRAYPKFRSVAATAEDTTLVGHSVGLITAGQAFHWFDRNKTRREFQRILAPRGWVVLIWNDRKTDASPFLKAYDQLLETYATDYKAVNHKNVDATVIGSFFGANSFSRVTFPNEQRFNFDGLRGRLLSSSYSPETGHPKHAPMLRALRQIFDKHQRNGEVVLACDTAVYYGQLGQQKSEAEASLLKKL